MNSTLALYNKLSRYPMGKWLFGKAIARRAPYFGTINPNITHLVPHRCEVILKKRKKVENHIGTVHVIAICNALELAMGVMAEASVPKHLRWIPKGMTLDYVAKAGTDITATATVKAEDWKPGDLMVEVVAKDNQGVEVVRGTIKLWISEKPVKS